MKKILKYFSVFTVFIALSGKISAEITKVEIKNREIYKNGKVFGDKGTYERLTGVAYGEVDPKNNHNKIIQDLKHAPVNKRGRVEYQSDIIILRPVDSTKANGLLFLSLPNRGNAFPVDDYLLTRGYTVVWCAWQGDVLPGANRVTMKVPVAYDNGKSITGKHRTEYQVRRESATLPLGFGYFNGDSHHSYHSATANNNGAVLTVRTHEADPKEVIPNDQWAFSDCSKAEFPGVSATDKISLKGGFKPGKLYELIYTAKDPLVLGMGFASIRDFVSYMKSDYTNTKIKAAVMQGISQCGLFVRTFIHLGFNADVKNKIVFEGVNTHIGPRRVALNIRFGRPGGGGGQRNDHTFPSFEAPFTWDVTTDPVSGIKGGLLERAQKSGTVPKIIQTFSSSEYWQLRASLRTTDPLGKKDLIIPENVRTYHFAGTQHTPSSFPDPVSGFNGNYNNYQPQMRAILLALERWVLEGKTPPQSKYPRISDGSLVLPEKESIGWPDIPGVKYNGMVNKGYLLDFGPQYNAADVTGILSEPPVENREKGYPVLVPKVNSDGNEIGGIHNVAMRVPLGTYTGWSLEGPKFGDGDLNGLNGMFIPFAKTKEERLKSRDPRLSLEERYISQENYVNLVKRAVNDLIQEGFLLEEDGKAAIEDAIKNKILP